VQHSSGVKHCPSAAKHGSVGAQHLEQDPSAQIVFPLAVHGSTHLGTPVRGSVMITLGLGQQMGSLVQVTYWVTGSTHGSNPFSLQHGSLESTQIWLVFNGLKSSKHYFCGKQQREQKVGPFSGQC